MGITGIWYNELGSVMDLSVSGNSISGSYRTKVGQAEGTYTLTGFVDGSSSPSQAVGFCVLWDNPTFGNTHALTAWSGQYQIIDNVEIITALWLLTTETAPSANWAATQVGQDIFVRTAPNPDEVQRQRQSRAASHPHSLAPA